MQVTARANEVAHLNSEGRRLVFQAMIDNVLCAFRGAPKASRLRWASDARKLVEILARFRDVPVDVDECSMSKAIELACEFLIQIQAPHLSRGNPSLH